ncbi:hypothetical protein [Granulicella sp. L60]|uniref:hypothetical protein n=1 Tax=Granulicella sp. L60 TaxID=1641866 RepID=UPI00131E6A05|nr:hypothetical protein [Granulicella sp. L60]
MTQAFIFNKKVALLWNAVTVVFKRSDGIVPYSCSDTRSVLILRPCGLRLLLLPDSSPNPVRWVPPVASITAVYNGDEQVEKGGKPVRIVKMFIPYGGGLIASAIYNGEIGLFTIEFRDNDGGYHGMVFRMPVKDASLGLSQLTSLIQTPADASSHLPEPSCSSELTAGKTLIVDPITSDIKPGDPALPAEYRALVYEHLVQTLETKADLEHVYRYGSREQHCANYTLDVTIRGFKKGNNVVRASAAYLGAFIGTTQLTYHLRITDRSGQVVIEQDLKKTVRGERESLDVTNQIAKATAKSLVKASKKSRAS